MSELQRANKVTAYWEAGGVACAIFYKTHNKVCTVRSTDVAVMTAGFVMPEGTDENPITAAQKLQSFKDFVSANATNFGIMYDPVDRRADEFKFPSRYDAENIKEFSGKMLAMAIEKVLGSVQANVVDRMVKAGNLPEGAEVTYATGDPTVEIAENYSNGFIKYASVNYPVTIDVAGNSMDTSVAVELVSGQLKKPRIIGDSVMTMSGVKDMLTAAGVLPVIEKKAKKDDAAEDSEGEGEPEGATEE